MPEYDPFLLTFNDKPRQIIQVFDTLVSRRREIENAILKRKRFPLLILAGGVPFLCLDFGLWLWGYPACIFSLVTIACGLGALIYFLALRSRQVHQFHPAFAASRDMLFTLRDDIDPRRVIFGSLDLTGTEQKTKIARTGRNTLGFGVTWYQDTWLNIKTKLVDGNMLRLSANRRLKVKDGYWGRGRVSGKSKWKAPKTKSDLQELKVMVSVNPNAYEVYPGAKLKPGTQVGAFFISQFDISGGIIRLQANSANPEITAVDVLGILRVMYNLLKRKESV